MLGLLGLGHVTTPNSEFELKGRRLQRWITDARDG